jgi:hypothetical protein
VPSTGPVDRSPPGQRPLETDEQRFADAYRGLAETHNIQASDLLISNPLAEYDLVGIRLVDLIDRTREQLSELPGLSPMDGPVGELGREMAATVTLLRAIDPHGSASERAMRYQAALDRWVERVQPRSDAIRAELGLPPSTTGDLRL